MVNSEYTDRSKPEYNWSPPNPKYGDSPEYQDRSTPHYYAPPPRFDAPYQPPFVAMQPTQVGPTFMTRVLWFVFIGWWLGILWTMAGYALCSTIIGLPLGLYMLNRLPQVLTLQPTGVSSYLGANGTVYSQVRPVRQLDFFLRAIYYLFVGCWLGILWTIVAYTLCVLLIPLPLGILMLNRLPLVMTLHQS